MLKIKLIALLILASFSYSKAQGNKQIFANYEFNNFNSNKIKGINLYIGANEAFSEFYNLKVASDTMYIDEYSDTVNFKIEVSDSIGNQYYLNPKGIIFRDHIYVENKLKPYIVNEPIPEFNWILKNETKYIDHFKCNLAMLKFRGREYEVWYTTEISTPFGPWKFYGLPGLMIYAETKDKNFRFKLKSFKYVSEMKIRKPNNGAKITFNEYVELNKNQINDFIKRLKTKLPRGARINVNSSTDNNLEKVF